VDEGERKGSVRTLVNEIQMLEEKGAFSIKSATPKKRGTTSHRELRNKQDDQSKEVRQTRGKAGGKKTQRPR